MAVMDAELARSLFTYEPDTGLLRWKVKPTQRVSVGDIAGTKTDGGYIRLMYKQQSYLAHRIAWAVHYGEWPSEQIDHRNRARSDNRIANLRLALASENARNNAPLHKRNTSGVKGVHYRAQRGKWQASARLGDKVFYFGTHDTVEAAAEARRIGAKRLFGEFSSEGDAHET